MNASPLRVELLTRIPANLTEFVEEIGEGITELYGSEAGAHYRLVAPQSLRASLSHPAVTAVAVGPGQLEGDKSATCAGIAVAITKAAVAQITLVHVLRECGGDGECATVIAKLVDVLRNDGVEGVVCEAVPMVPLDLKTPFQTLGFRRIERLLMVTELTEGGIARPSLRQGKPLARDQVRQFAEVIVAAYRDHPGRQLHAEVRDAPAAAAFLDSAMSGGFGATRAAFTRVINRDERIVAGIVGSEIARGIGFVLQVAVDPAYQGMGLGTVLIRELAQSFYEGGLRRMGLGVTMDNPARRLYERLGFRNHRAVDAFVWWRSST